MKSAIGLLSKLSIITLVMAFSVNSYASSNDVHEGLTCDAKKQAIEAKIEQAKKANNTFEITGLEKALQQVNTNCSDDTLEQKYKRLVEEKSKNVSDKTKKLAEKTKEYEKDGINANQDKIDALKSKLHDAEKELTEAKNKLADYYDKVNTK
ncbi:DUF1090 domain-containing protein [Gilliamella sp. B2776]|uniref:DUF1090 domain-containing protein n=1 Tax=unclassified Gilliamella TaxID=2685620 RepID=UPI00226AD8C3|nr:MULTISPECIES: DUF1090 domain-containing protein [unclassified Gilliamella]MCX8649179.1 DUF1090 domain-containing protein [Gilliamella sp. B2779]MCX8652945.1 DUF1090 domain-containing protein [Gilliamella sp. B2737]MCX8655207.1 DUF1090 domain-containing protein [Gilliamella sp. B2894]MCX8664690.1 DUF1090 domain-containing protein [Gilliamella sp. B2887]MCX8690991.1 DUF1090 domain-containing protein [Gilliamella sp. B2776]